MSEENNEIEEIKVGKENSAPNPKLQEVEIDIQPKANPFKQEKLSKMNIDLKKLNTSEKSQTNVEIEMTERSMSQRIVDMFGGQKDNIFNIPGLDEPDVPEKANNLNFSYISRGGTSHRGPRSRRGSQISDRGNINFHTESGDGRKSSLSNNMKDIEVQETGDEDFDFNQAADGDSETKQGTASVTQTYFNMFKCFIGIGILATPAAIAQVGIFGGAIGIFICGCINLYTMKMQVACKTKIGPHITSYSELGFAIYGAWGKAIIDGMIVISQFGFCIAYLIFIGKQIDQVICIETQQDYCGNKNTYIFISALIITPVCWLRDFKFLSYVSLFANVSIVSSLIIIMVYSEKEYVDQPALHENIRYLQIDHLPLFFGIAVFNFEGNGVILNLHASMADPSTFDKMMRNVLISIIAILIIFGVATYESFGNQIQDMVTMNLPHDNLTTTVQVVYSLGLLGTYPMQIVPAIDITEKTNIFKSSPNPFTKYDNPYIKNIILRTVIVIMSGIMAQIIPKFGLFINLTGAFACTGLAFIFPILMYNKLHDKELSITRKRFHYFLIAFGLICGTISFIMSLIEIVEAFSENEETVIPV